LFGDLPSEGPISTDQIKAAVRKFRRRHALQELGGIDSICLDLLNRNPEDVRKQLLVNLERCRWMPLPNAGRVLVVNVPDYKLYAIKDGVKIWEMPVVVGEELWPTVSFSGRLNQVVLNPYWVVPLTILQKELVQKIIADPNYLSINRFEVVGRSGRTVNPARINWQAWSKGSLPYELRQKPGNGNPLGKIKFYFPNNHAVYLHDTPSKALFDRSERGFSHGCIRLYDARKVLDFVLEESVNRISTVDALLSTGKEHWIPVQPAVPVRIVYFTAWVDRSGTLQIRKDLYQRDAVIAAKLIAQ
jgi:murein L,D-transpeptidase YcbB/YkuD